MIRPRSPSQWIQRVPSTQSQTVVDAVSCSHSRQSRRTIPAGNLAVEIAAIENAVDPSKIGSDKRTSVYISLTQSHLETLDECGAVEFDNRSKTVSPTDATEPLAEYIRRLQTACYNPDSEDA